MQTVVETPGFLASAKAAGISDAVRARIVTTVAETPEAGELLVGSGGLRKFRFARPGEGKSGGYRILSFYISEAFPVFLIAVFAKNQKANISLAERAELSRRLKVMAEAYRRKDGSR